MIQDVSDLYGNKVRVRICGLCWHGHDLLMVNHRGLREGDFWAPPGGGVILGQTTEETLKREFLEETGLEIEVGRFLFGCEYIRVPLHAIELFFESKVVKGTLTTGADPELQIITEARFLHIEEIFALPPEEVHGIFRLASNAGELRKLSGFYKI